MHPNSGCLLNRRIAIPEGKRKPKKISRAPGAQIILNGEYYRYGRGSAAQTPESTFIIAMNMGSLLRRGMKHHDKRQHHFFFKTHVFVQLVDDDPVAGVALVVSVHDKTAVFGILQFPLVELVAPF